MILSWGPRALVQLEENYRYIARDNPTAAAAVVRRIETVSKLLASFPSTGRSTDRAGVRIIGVHPYPYLVFYKVLAEKSEVRILRVRHMARRAPAREGW